MTLKLLPLAMQCTSILGCNKEFKYYEITGTIINDMGTEIPALSQPITYIGSIQAVTNNLYSQLNLDLGKNYKTLYCPELLVSIADKPIPGRIEYSGKYYDIINNQNWWESNGYTQCVMCEIKALNDDFYY